MTNKDKLEIIKLYRLLEPLNSLHQKSIQLSKELKIIEMMDLDEKITIMENELNDELFKLNLALSIDKSVPGYQYKIESCDPAIGIDEWEKIENDFKKQLEDEYKGKSNIN
jgi:hypothetical protein